MDENISHDLQEAVARQAGQDTYSSLQPLFEELWAQREQQLPHEARFASAERIGERCVQIGQHTSTAIAHVLGGGRALIELAQNAGRLDAEGGRRLQSLVDEAAVQVAAGVEKARRARRGQWLSYLAHELKNPLNTILNALWLLRERGGDKKTSGRFVELAERAVKRIEGRIIDMRGLDEHLVSAPPGWEALHGGAHAEKSSS